MVSKPSLQDQESPTRNNQHVPQDHGRPARPAKVLRCSPRAGTSAEENISACSCSRRQTNVPITGFQRRISGSRLSSASRVPIVDSTVTCFFGGAGVSRRSQLSTWPTAWGVLWSPCPAAGQGPPRYSRLASRPQLSTCSSHPSEPRFQSSRLRRTPAETPAIVGLSRPRGSRRFARHDKKTSELRSTAPDSTRFILATDAGLTQQPHGWVFLHEF
jgi:hypothetical protein